MQVFRATATVKPQSWQPSGGRLHWDTEGRILWRKQTRSGDYFNCLLAPDGHVFIERNMHFHQNTMLGGLLGGYPSYLTRWVCLDPQGRLLWQEEPDDLYTSTVMPGRDGCLFYQREYGGKLACIGPGS